MNVYHVTIEPKPVSGAGIGPYGNGRTLSIVTSSLQEAMSIARGKISGNEEIAGIYTSATDVIVDYSQITQGN